MFNAAPFPFYSLCFHIQKAKEHKQSRSKKSKLLRETNKFVKIILSMNTKLVWKKDIARKYIFLPHFSNKREKSEDHKVNDGQNIQLSTNSKGGLKQKSKLCISR